MQFSTNIEPWFLVVNPSELALPIDHDGMISRQSNALLCCVDSQFGRGTLFPDDLYDCAMVDMRKDRQLGMPMSGLNLVPLGLVRTAQEKRGAAAIEAGDAWLTIAFTALDEHLSGKANIVGTRVTFANTSVRCTVNRWYLLDVKRSDNTHLRARSKWISHRVTLSKKVHTELRSFHRSRLGSSMTTERQGGRSWLSAAPLCRLTRQYRSRMRQ